MAKDKDDPKTDLDRFAQEPSEIHWSPKTDAAQHMGHEDEGSDEG